MEESQDTQPRERPSEEPCTPGPVELEASADQPQEPIEPEAEDGAGESDGDGSDPAAAAEIAASLASLDSRLEEAQRLLERQSKVIDRLHAENQELRAGELRNAQAPLVRDLLRLHDDVGRLRGIAGGDGDLRIVHESLGDVLSRNGIQAFAAEPGEPFDPHLHAAAGVEPTDEEALDKTVAEVTKQGFRWESGGAIRVAEVRAYRYRGTDSRD